MPLEAIERKKRKKQEVIKLKQDCAVIESEISKNIIELVSLLDKVNSKLKEAQEKDAKSEKV